MGGGFALWNYGFRPFYLLASLHAAAGILVWIAQYSGLVSQPWLAGPVWHAHEMLFGFTVAVMAGFLLTAVATWTQQPPTRGAVLAGLALLWLAGRILLFTPFGSAAAAANALFPAAVAVAVAVPLVRTGNRRNFGFIALMLLLGAFALLVHLAAGGTVALPATLGLQAGLDVVLIVMAIIAGRVVPMFTNNGVPGTRASRHPLLERLALGSLLALLAADVLQSDGWLIATLALLAAAAHAGRLLLWRPWRTLRTPLVWILHASYAWIAVHLALRGFAALGWLGSSVATHALTVGAIGGLTLGMMTRTARGHTGLPLRAGRAELAMYLLVQLAAIARVGGGFVESLYLVSLQASGLLWAAAFSVYFVRYLPILWRPRADGRPG
ncbi:MAG: NnrS family protein [Burkholderiaceae bacterium]|nr:NnrS family protein [Burkholderiaceae bacterium]